MREMEMEFITAIESIFLFIRNKDYNRFHVAVIYSQLLMQTTNPVDWPVINKAIVDRWSMSGLKYIKTKAWKLLKGRVA